MIFFVIALVLLVAEMVVWWATSPLRKQDQFHAHLEEYARNASLRRRTIFTNLPDLASSSSVFAQVLQAIETGVIQIALLPLRLLPPKHGLTQTAATEAMIRAHFLTLRGLTARNWLQRVFFTPLEFANLVWAVYLLSAQTIGAFNNCACMTSTWGGFGGYLDFTQLHVANSASVEEYWIIGTITTCVVMGAGMGYIVLEVTSLPSYQHERDTNLKLSGCYRHISIPKTTTMPCPD